MSIIQRILRKIGFVQEESTIILSRKIKHRVEFTLPFILCVLIMISLIGKSYLYLNPTQLKDVEGNDVGDDVFPVYIEQCKCQKYISRIQKRPKRQKRRDLSAFYENQPQEFPQLPDKLKDLRRWIEYKLIRLEYN